MAWLIVTYFVIGLAVSSCVMPKCAKEIAAMCDDDISFGFVCTFCLLGVSIAWPVLLLFKAVGMILRRYVA